MSAKAAKKTRKVAKDRRVQVIEQIIEQELPGNIYEVAQAPWLTRSWIYEGIADAKSDITPTVRLELLRQARNWEKNDPIVKRLVSVFGQYTFGPNGLAAIPSSSEEGFNESASLWMKSWSKFPSLTSQHPLSVLQGVMSRRWFIDGEVFCHLTRSPETLRPRIQLIESQRVSNPGTDKAPDTGNQIIDGCELTDYGRTIAFWVASTSQGAQGSYMGGPYPDAIINSGLVAGSYPYTNTRGVTYTRVPTENMVHLFEPERPEQLRGLTHLYPVMRTIHDLWDLKKLEMLAAKDQAETARYITNAEGKANPRTLRAQQMAIPSTDAAGNQTSKKVTTYTQSTQGGNTRYLRTGEDVKFMESNRPSITTQWYWDFLVRTICAGTGISALLIYPFSLQGTVTRADLDVMASFFRTKSAAAAAVMREIYVYAMGWAVRYDQSLDGAPDDWAEVTIRPPRSVNVDVGRNAQALIAEYEAGFRTLSEICAELGHDWRHVLRQKFVEAKFINDLLTDPKFAGVTRDQVIQSVKQAVAPTPAPAVKNESDYDLISAASAELAGVL